MVGRMGFIIITYPVKMEGGFVEDFTTLSGSPKSLNKCCGIGQLLILLRLFAGAFDGLVFQQFN